MSHGIRRLRQTKALEFARCRARRIGPWCEWIAMVIAVLLVFARLRTEIGDWQALLATAGAPLAIIDGPGTARLIARQARRLLRLDARPYQRQDGGQPFTLSITCTPHGQDIVISARPSDPVPVAEAAHRQNRHPAMPNGFAPHAPVQTMEPPDRHEVAVYLPPIGRSQHCVLFAVDIAQFTDARRDDEVQLALREALYRLLIDSFEGSGISWRSCVHEDRGDGVIVVIPAHMPTITIVHPLVGEIRTRLRRYNRLSSQVAQLRLRLAAHIGEVYRDRHGLAGNAVNHLFRILDAPDLRDVLVSTESEVALIVSDYIYENVIRGGPHGVDPTAYCAVTVCVKQFRARAWLLERPDAADIAWRPG